MHTTLLSCVGMLQARRHKIIHIPAQVVVIEVHRLCIAVLCLADYGKFNTGRLVGNSCRNWLHMPYMDSSSKAIRWHGGKNVLAC